MKTERVANLLNDWLSSNRYQQTALAREAELTQLSFLRNGIRGMTRDALERILPAQRRRCLDRRVPQPLAPPSDRQLGRRHGRRVAAHRHLVLALGQQPGGGGRLPPLAIGGIGPPGPASASCSSWPSRSEWQVSGRFHSFHLFFSFVRRLDDVGRDFVLPGDEKWTSRASRAG